jgi:hypothetical protein
MGHFVLCRSPFVRDPFGKVFKMALLTDDKDLYLKGIPFPCGQCLPCRINRRRVWTHRLMLESYAHGDAVFVTLTYAPEHLPEGGSLDKRHVQLFLKRLRKSLSPRRLRYYAAGEYGENTKRPHYHFILFGAALDFDGEAIARAWPFGLAHVGTFTEHSASYVAGYVTKKHVKKSDVFARVPEFSLMSRKPGIGYFALDDVCKLLDNPQFQEFIQIKKDVPEGLKHGKTFYPFGRYLREKLRQLMEVNVDTDTFVNEMRVKYMEARSNDKTLTEHLLSESLQRNRQIEARHKIFNRRSRSEV